MIFAFIIPLTGPHEFGRPPMHHGHPALHMRNEQQGKLFYGEEGHQVRRTIDKELKPGPVPGMRYILFIYSFCT